LVYQVKITVIATGFDESRQRLRDISNRPLHASLPIVDANQPQEEDKMNGEKKEFTEPKDQGDTELDIPAFLRQGR
jgi:hypothetical protein